MINGGNPANVYWQVGSSATLGTGTAFTGRILAQVSVTVVHGARINGAALAVTGAVTMDDNAIIVPNFVSQFAFAGEYGVTTGSGSHTLASIAQNAGTLTLNGTLTTATATITNATQILVNGTDTATYVNSKINFTSGTFAGETWTKLDLPGDYTNQSGAATHVIQNGTSVTFVDKFGNNSPGIWLTPTTLSATAWNQTVTTAPGKLVWQDGTVWSENLVLNGSANGGTTTIMAAPSQEYVLDYVNGTGQAVHLVQTGTKTVIFIDGTGHMSLGTFINPTQATTAYLPGQIATISNDMATVTWTDGTVWTRTAATSAITVTNYTNQNGIAVHLIQNGTNQLTMFDGLGQVSLGTMQSSTTALFDLYPGDLATISGNTVTWQDGYLWTKTTTPVSSPVVVLDYVNSSGNAVHLVQTGTNTIIFIDGTGHMSLGTFINDTQATTPYFPGDVATISSDLTAVTWTDGTVWTQTASTSAITVTNYTNQNGTAVHLIQNGTNQLTMIDGVGRISLGTMQSLTTALFDLYPGDVATISGSTVMWQDGSFWGQTNYSPVTTALTDTNGVLSHIKLTSPTTFVGLDGPRLGVTGTRVNNEIVFASGSGIVLTFNNVELNSLIEMGTGYP